MKSYNYGCFNQRFHFHRANTLQCLMQQCHNLSVPAHRQRKLPVPREVEHSCLATSTHCHSTQRPLTDGIYKYITDSRQLNVQSSMGVRWPVLLVPVAIIVTLQKQTETRLERHADFGQGKEYAKSLRHVAAETIIVVQVKTILAKSQQHYCGQQGTSRQTRESHIY